MVADSGGVGGLRPAVAIGCAAVIVLCIGVGLFIPVWYPEWDGLLGQVPTEKPPEVLAQDARAILESLGHSPPVADRVYRFEFWTTYLWHIRDNDPSPDRWGQLGSGRSPAVVFLILWTVLLLPLGGVGLLSVCSFWAFSFLWSSTSNFPSWNAATSVMITPVMLALAAYGFYTSLAGRPLLREGVIPEVEGS